MNFSIAVASVSFKYYYPNHKFSNNIDRFIGNLTVSNGQKAMLSLVESYQVQLESQTTKSGPNDQDIENIEYSHLQKFGDIIIGEFYNLSDIKTAILMGPVPMQVSDFVVKRVIAGNYKYCPNSLDYTANEHNNGGAGFKYCLTIQKPKDLEMYQMIYTIAGRVFTVASDVQYREETIPQVITLTEQGLFGEYAADKVVNRIEQKQIVKPRYLKEGQFETIVRATYIEYAHEEAQKQLKAELHHIKKMIGQ